MLDIANSNIINRSQCLNRKNILICHYHYALNSWYVRSQGLKLILPTLLDVSLIFYLSIYTIDQVRQSNAVSTFWNIFTNILENFITYIF
jgi:hypothetical protein